MTKYTDLLSLNKTNILYQKIIEKINDQILIDEKLINEIIEEINNEFMIENLLIPQYDLNKIIAACFELNDLGFIDHDILFSLLNKLDFNEKKTLIFDNISFINYEKCKTLLNNFNILIICNDIRDVITNFTELELCCFIYNDSVFDVVDIEKLISYIEKKSSLMITKEDINNYLNSSNNDLKNSTINFYLKTL